MRILLLEDRGSVSKPITEVLEDAGHTVFEAGEIDDAQSIWEDKEIDCLIVDLLMSPSGLTPPEIAESQNGLLSGWVWLKYHVYAEKPFMRERTTILTEYSQQLRESVPPGELKGVRIVPKKGGSPTEQVLAHIAAIEKLIRRRTP